MRPFREHEPHRQRWLRTLIRVTVRPCRAFQKAGGQLALRTVSEFALDYRRSRHGFRTQALRLMLLLLYPGSLPVRECRSLAPRAPARNGHPDRSIVGHTNHISAGARMVNKDEGGSNGSDG